MPASQAAPRLLGEFLRERRSRLRPQDFGLAPGLRRRTPGLRREEVATLCGISPTWYTWIEQGRTASVSEDTLAALAAGLRLDRAERAYLFELMSRADPSRPAGPSADAIELRALVDAVRAPAYVLDRDWDAVVWNRPAGRLFADWLGSPGRARSAQDRAEDETRGGPHNLLRYVFLDPRSRALIVDWPERARRLVAEYRADSAGWPEDPVRQRLLAELGAGSAEFAQAWRAQQVLSREGGLRGFRLPGGELRQYRQFTLRVAQSSEHKLIVLSPA